jgi:hypothetical protein
MHIIATFYARRPHVKYKHKSWCELIKVYIRCLPIEPIMNFQWELWWTFNKRPFPTDILMISSLFAYYMVIIWHTISLLHPYILIISLFYAYFMLILCLSFPYNILILSLSYPYNILIISL